MSVSRYESGSARPMAQTISRLASAYGVDPDDVIRAIEITAATTHAAQSEYRMMRCYEVEMPDGSSHITVTELTPPQVAADAATRAGLTCDDTLPRVRSLGLARVYADPALAAS